jgi:hypothetical protein
LGNLLWIFIGTNIFSWRRAGFDRKGEELSFSFFLSAGESAQVMTGNGGRIGPIERRHSYRFWSGPGNLEAFNLCGDISGWFGGAPGGFAPIETPKDLQEIFHQAGPLGGDPTGEPKHAGHPAQNFMNPPKNGQVRSGIIARRNHPWPGKWDFCEDAADFPIGGTGVFRSVDISS